MRLTLNSFSDDAKLHTGFYSDKAYSMFREIIKEITSKFSYRAKFYVFRNNLFETIICSDFPTFRYSILNDSSRNMTHQEGIKAAIAKYMSVYNDDYYREIQLWAECIAPSDAEKFKELVGTPANPIEAAMKDVLFREETKVNEKFKEFRNELSNRKFKSSNALFIEDISRTNGNCGYSQSIGCASHLQIEKVNELLAAENSAHEALQALISAAIAYESAQVKWHKVNKEIKHLLIEAKNKEIISLRKQVKKVMNCKKNAH